MECNVGFLPDFVINEKVMPVSDCTYCLFTVIKGITSSLRYYPRLD